MENLNKLTASSLFASAVVFASKASAAATETPTNATEGWGHNVQPDKVPTDIEGAIMNVTNYILGFVTIIATLIVIYGGVLYLTAAGNDDQVGKAKSTIAAGIIGIIICGLAYALVIVVSTVILTSD